MSTPTDEQDYHENNFLVELARYLGLDPAIITTMTVEGETDEDLVIISWQGYTTMPVAKFNEILNNVDMTKVSRAQ